MRESPFPAQKRGVSLLSRASTLTARWALPNQEKVKLDPLQGVNVWPPFILFEKGHPVELGSTPGFVLKDGSGLPQVILGLERRPPACRACIHSICIFPTPLPDLPVLNWQLPKVSIMGPELVWFHAFSLFFPRGSQKDYRKDVRVGTKVACWFVHNNGEGLLDGTLNDYIVPDLF